VAGRSDSFEIVDYGMVLELVACKYEEFFLVYLEREDLIIVTY
jgi:hypothetical protein